MTEPMFEPDVAAEVLDDPYAAEVLVEVYGAEVLDPPIT